MIHMDKIKIKDFEKWSQMKSEDDLIHCVQDTFFEDERSRASQIMKRLSFKLIASLNEAKRKADEEANRNVMILE